ncbi:NADH-quinone oxidoreductase subunit N, partial [Planctomycetota bacterium]
MVAINHGMAWLAVVAGLNTAISCYYYAYVIKTMYFDEGEESALQVPAVGQAIVLLHAAAVVYLGVFFDQLASWTR